MSVAAKRSDRQARAYQEAGSYLVMPASVEGNDWWVSKLNGSTYTVDLTAGTCTCPDFQKRGSICKHQHLAAFHAEAEAPQQERIPEPAPSRPVMSEERYQQALRDREALWG